MTDPVAQAPPEEERSDDDLTAEYDLLAQLCEERGMSRARNGGGRRNGRIRSMGGMIWSFEVFLDFDYVGGTQALMVSFFSRAKVISGIGDSVV